MKNAANEAPVITITSPATNDLFGKPATILINANASDPDDNITKVEFFNGATKIGEDLTAPYSFNWTNVQAGTYAITAKATDAEGLTATSQAVTVYVVNQLNLEPVADAYVRGGTNANSNFGTATELWVKNDPQEVFTRVTYLKFDLSNYSNPADLGKLRMSIISGNTATPTIQRQLYYVPTDTWTETGITWNNRPATTTLLATQQGRNSGTVEWDILNQINAEIAGDKVLTLAIVGSVANTSGDVRFSSREVASTNLRPQLIIDTKPQITLTAPANDTTVNDTASLTISAMASDDKVVSNVKFYVNREEKATVQQAPYTWQWTNLLPGAYSLTAKATDNAGLAATTGAVSVTVKDVTPPVITCPANIETDNDEGQCGAAVIFAATATDNPGDPVISYSHNSGSVFPVGTTTVTITATDTAGNSSTCSFKITVTDAEKPVITICPPPKSAYADGSGQAPVPNYVSEVQARIVCMSMAKAYKEMPDEKTVIPANVIALKVLILSSKRNRKYSGTLLALLP